MSELLPARTTTLPTEPGHERFKIIVRLPLTLHVVSWALIAAAAVNIVFNGVRLIGFDATRYVAGIHRIEAQRHQPRLSDSAVLSSLVGLLVLVVLFAAFEAVLAILIRRGRNWARIVATVFLGLGVVVQVVQQPIGPAFIFGFFITAVALAVVWLLWLPPSNRYFRAVGAARRQHRSARIAAAVPLHPAAWVTDPSGRYQHRYWDGGKWTEHVADYGIAAIDPL